MVSVPTRVADAAHSFDALVLIGRFQPFHIGHLHLVQQALQRSAHLVLLCGSADMPRSVRNPWSFEERAAMIRASLPDGDHERVTVAPLVDVLYDDDAWVRAVQTVVADAGFDAGSGQRLGLIGHHKDATSYYLDLFPGWQACHVDNYRGISATPIREALLREACAIADVEVSLAGEERLPLGDLLPHGVRGRLGEFAAEAATELQREQLQVDAHRQAWAGAPYPPILVTADALVTCGGQVLLIERGGFPGRGLWALPGGFVDADELLFDASLRELAEETRLQDAITVAQLRAAYRATRVFDEPTRSVRGRTITHAFWFDLQVPAPPPVLAADDAARAFWTPLATLPMARMFEDHYFIIRSMLGADALAGAN